jgi:plasmid stabilization system protein ParE
MQGYKIINRPQAEIHVCEIVVWYEAIMPGLGEDFLNEYKQHVENILTKTPSIYRIVNKNTRKLKLKRFSAYNVYYHVNDEKKEVVVLAVVHQSRHPKAWMKFTI